MVVGYPGAQCTAKGPLALFPNAGKVAYIGAPQVLNTDDTDSLCHDANGESLMAAIMASPALAIPTHNFASPA